MPQTLDLGVHEPGQDRLCLGGGEMGRKLFESKVLTGALHPVSKDMIFYFYCATMSLSMDVRFFQIVCCTECI